MKKLISVLLMGLLFTMCGVKKEEVKTETTSLPKKIVIGLDDTFAPMGFKNQAGEIVGLDIDLAKATAKKLNMEVEFKSINWDSKILDLNNGSIDLIWNGLTITEERKEQTEMSEPYMNNNQIIIVQAGSDINTKADLAGKNVGTQSQSSSEEIILNEGLNKNFKEFKTYAQFDQAFMDLDFGRIDAIVVDEYLAKYIKKIKEDKAQKELYKILDESLGFEETGVAAKKGNKVLIDAINKTIAELKADGTFDEIKKNWLKD